MTRTAQEQLDAVEEAIFQFMSNGALQQYTVNSRLVQRSQIGELRAWRDQLRGEVAASKPGGTVNYFQRGRI